MKVTFVKDVEERQLPKSLLNVKAFAHQQGLETLTNHGPLSFPIKGCISVSKSKVNLSILVAARSHGDKVENKPVYLLAV